MPYSHERAATDRARPPQADRSARARARGTRRRGRPQQAGLHAHHHTLEALELKDGHGRVLSSVSESHLIGAKPHALAADLDGFVSGESQAWAEERP